MRNVKHYMFRHFEWHYFLNSLLNNSLLNSKFQLYYIQETSEGIRNTLKTGFLMQISILSSNDQQYILCHISCRGVVRIKKCFKCSSSTSTIPF